MTDSSNAVKTKETATLTSSSNVNSPEEKEVSTANSPYREGTFYYWGTYPGDYLD